MAKTQSRRTPAPSTPESTSDLNAVNTVHGSDKSARDILKQASAYSADDDMQPIKGRWLEFGYEPYLTGNPDAVSSIDSQANRDLVEAEKMEASGATGPGDCEDYFDLPRSTMYWKCRNSFVEAAASGDETAYATSFWRAYTAGRLCPNRLPASPSSPKISIPIGPYLDTKESRSWFGTAHNTALAAAATIESDQETEDVVDHIAELTHSPMFRLAVEDFERSIRDSTSGDPRFPLAQFAARMFLGGTLYVQPAAGISAKATDSK